LIVARELLPLIAMNRFVLIMLALVAIAHAEEKKERELP